MYEIFYISIKYNRSLKSIYKLPQKELANVLDKGPNNPLSNLSLNLYMLFLHHLDDDRCPKAI